MKIPLAKVKFAIIDAADRPMISKYSWHLDERPNGLCYAYTNVGRKTVRMHNMICPDAKPECDHRNGGGLDNRRCNLRPATRAQNAHNYRKIKKSGLSSQYKGVTFQSRLKRRPWQSRIGNLHLGYFASAEEAAAAYDRAAEQQRGEYAKTNGLTVFIRPNHRYKVVSKAFRLVPTPGHPEARVMVYVLACGHTHTVAAFKAYKIGKESRCKTCSEGK